MAVISGKVSQYMLNSHQLVVGYTSEQGYFAFTDAVLI